MSSEVKLFIELARICKSTYPDIYNHKKLTLFDEEITHQKIIHGFNKRRFCRVYWNSSSVIFAFRGTSYISDWFVSNLKVRTKDLRISDTRAVKVPVHSGFQNTLDYLDRTTEIPAFDAMLALIDEKKLLNNRRLFVTGHSLGGALAMVFISRLYELRENLVDRRKLRIVTFGSPAVGRKKFKMYFEDKFKNVLRIVNRADLVAFTPPVFYEHVGKEIWLSTKKRKINVGWKKRLLFSFSTPWSYLSDHNLDEYIRVLNEQIV